MPEEKYATWERLARIETTLEEQTRDLKEVKAALLAVATQQEQIVHIQKSLTTLWSKYDRLMDPKDGILMRVVNYQATCPRKTIRWLWLPSISACLVLIGIAARMFGVL